MKIKLTVSSPDFQRITNPLSNKLKVVMYLRFSQNSMRNSSTMNPSFNMLLHSCHSRSLPTLLSIATMENSINASTTNNNRGRLLKTKRQSHDSTNLTLVTASSAVPKVIVRDVVHTCLLSLNHPCSHKEHSTILHHGNHVPILSQALKHPLHHGFSILAPHIT